MHVSPLMWILLFGVFKSAQCIPECMRHSCVTADVISCNHSMILLVTDVTNGRLNRNKKTFEDVKTSCMGKTKCSLPPSCDNKTDQLYVHYFCVNSSHVRSKTCNGSVAIEALSGFIQSPSYPRYFERNVPCRWSLEAPKNNVMVLSLHDIVIRGGTELCDGGIKVTGSKCDEENRVTQSITLCTSEDERILSVIRCSQVDIEVDSTPRNYHLKFWMSFHARPILQTSMIRNVPSPLNFQASMLPCSGWIYYMDTGNFGQYSSVTFATTQIPDMSLQGNNTELLIIMLSIISGFSIVLLVILIVVCIRCHLLQNNHTEYLYTETSSGLQEHNQYISSLEIEKYRPHLADGYYEVADAIPPSQRGATPTSPAYAEVENIVNLRKGPWSDENIKGSKPILLQTDEKVKMKTYDGLTKKGRPKSGAQTNKSGDNDNRSDVDLRNSQGPVIYMASIKKSRNSISETVNESGGCLPADSVPDDISLAYEPIGQFSNEKVVRRNSDTFSQSNVINFKVQLKNFLDNQPLLDFNNSTKTLNRLSNKTSQDNANKCEHQLKGSNTQTNTNQGTMKTSTIRNNVMKTEDMTQVSQIKDGSKTLPSKNHKSLLEVQAVKNNNYKFTDCSDLQGSKGIVRNGIKMFEKNGAVS